MKRNILLAMLAALTPLLIYWISGADLQRSNGWAAACAIGLFGGFLVFLLLLDIASDAPTGRQAP